ncbi:MAG: DUF4386 domain-containing protein [Leptospiraceae bacterium]|nr:DUF4386 domain-containing protein [Leptospiraceae bacterium]
MKEFKNDLKLSQISKIAGIGYLIIFVTGIFSNFFILEKLFNPNNALSTMENIISNNLLFRIGFLGFLLMVIFDVILSWALYLIFEQTDRALSLLSAILRLINCAIFGFALFFLLDILHLVSKPDYLIILGNEKIALDILSSFHSFNSAWLLGLVFFGIHLFFLGKLIIKSDFFPSWVGVFLYIAGFGYLVDSFANFLYSDYHNYKDIFQAIVVIPGIIGEFSLTVLLLKKNVKLENKEEV